MGVALPSLGILVETQNLEARLLPGPFFFLSLFFLVAFVFFCLLFLLSFFSFFLQWSNGADHGMGAGLEEKAARGKNGPGRS